MIPFYKTHTVFSKDNISFQENRSLYNFSSLKLNKSCSQSLELAVLCLDLEPSDEIIIPSYSFVSLANAIYNYGFKPVFVDCDRTFCMNVKLLEKKISKKNY